MTAKERERIAQQAEDFLAECGWWEATGGDEELTLTMHYESKRQEAMDRAYRTEQERRTRWEQERFEAQARLEAKVISGQYVTADDFFA
jgi:hypothetical protein